MMKRIVMLVVVMIVGSYGYLSATSIDTRGILIVLRNVDQIRQVGTLGGDRIYDVVWSPDGRWLAMVGSRSVYIYDANNWDVPPKQIATNSDELWSVPFTPDGNKIVVNGEVWEIEPFGKYGDVALAGDHGISLQTVAFHPEGRLMASSLTYWGEAILDADPNSFEVAPRAFGLANSSVSSLNFSHSGEQYMITSALVGSIRYEFAMQYPLGNFGIWIWQVEDLIGNGQNWTRDEAIAQGALLQLEGHPEGVRHGVFSHDDATVATAGLDGRVRLWDTATGEMLLDIDAHYEAAWDVDFSRDDAVAASVGWDGRLKFWDTVTGDNVGIDDHYQTALTAVAYSPDGTHLVIGGWDGRVWIRDLVTNEEQVLRHSHFWEHWDIDFSPDDYYLAVAADNNEIWIWDLERRVEYRGLRGHEGPVHSVDFSPDGRRLVSGSMDQTVRVWDVEREMEVMLFDEFQNSVKRVLYSPDGNLIAGADFGGMIYVWDADSGALRYHFQAESDAIVFSVDGQYLATGAEAWRLDGSSRMFDRRDVADRNGGRYFQDDSTNFDGRVQLRNGEFYDVEAEAYIFHHDRFERCTKRDWAFNHESSLAAIACDDGDIQLWGIGQ